MLYFKDKMHLNTLSSELATGLVSFRIKLHSFVYVKHVYIHIICAHICFFVCVNGCNWYTEVFAWYVSRKCPYTSTMWGLNSHAWLPGDQSSCKEEYAAGSNSNTQSFIAWHSNKFLVYSAMIESVLSALCVAKIRHRAMGDFFIFILP